MIWKRYLISLMLFAILIAGMDTAAADWLDGSGPNYGALRSYFSDPIFYSGGPSSKVDYSQYQNYFGSKVFKDPISLGSSKRAPIPLGKMARELAKAKEDGTNESGENLSAVGADPRENRMIDPALLSSRKDWTKTMDFVQNKSSLRVYEGGKWTQAQDVETL